MTFKELFEAEKKQGMTVYDMYTNCPAKMGYEASNNQKCRSMKYCEVCWNREVDDPNAVGSVSEVSVKTIRESVSAERKVQRHKTICAELNRIYEAKNHDYGDSFHQSYVEDGLTMAKIRIGDKYSRFKSLLKSDQKVKDESIRDTLMDMANYCIMTVMELEA